MERPWFRATCLKLQTKTNKVEFYGDGTVTVLDISIGEERLTFSNPHAREVCQIMELVECFKGRPMPVSTKNMGLADLIKRPLNEIDNLLRPE